MRFKIIDLEVGINFVEINIADENGSCIEIRFIQTERELMNNSLKAFGFLLTDKDLDGYEY